VDVKRPPKTCTLYVRPFLPPWIAGLKSAQYLGLNSQHLTLNLGNRFTNRSVFSLLMLHTQVPGTSSRWYSFPTLLSRDSMTCLTIAGWEPNESEMF